MKFIITGRGIDVTEGLRQCIEEKFGKLENYFNADTEVHVTLSVQKDNQKVEVTIPMQGTTIRCEEVSNDMYVTIDLLEEILERQLRRNRKKLIDRKQNVPSFSSYFIDNTEDKEDDESPIKIVRSKRFGVKPMDPEEACFQMDMLGHDFYVFCNAQTDQVNVVYKRKDGNYGLIEPEF